MKNRAWPLLRRITNQWSLTPLILLVLLLAAIHPAAAVTTTASNGLSCAGTRSTANLGCNAGEFTTIVNITNAPGAPTSCVAGEYVIYNGTVSLSGTNADRYDIGFFTGENGNDPALNNASNFCSVATFPTSPPPWIAKDTDACGDFSAAGVDTAIINNIKVLCAGDATGALMVPYTLVYSQNAGSVCTGSTNVVGGSTSKCNKGIAVVPVATFTVNGSVTVTKQTVPDIDAQSFAFTASGTGPVMTGDTSFNLTDNVSKQVRMGISGTNRTLTITETDTNLWESTAIITCTKPDGSSSAGFVTTDGATRTITATLSNTNPNALCTITNKRAVSATNSTVVADPTSVLSDGVSTSTITVTLKDTSVVGNPVAGKTVTLTAGSGSSTITTVSGVTDANGQAIFTVKNTVAESVTYTATDTTDGITIAQTATVTFFSVSSFNAFETSTAANAIIGNIYTKLAGTAFGLDVVAIADGSQATGFSGNIKVELLANTGTAGSGYGADNCPTSNSVIQTIASTAIAGGRSTVNFAAVADAYRDVRVRISYPTTSPTITVCSNDSFAIRPQSLTVTSSNANADSTGTSTVAAPVIKAGSAFALTATAVAGYSTTPVLNASQASAHAGAVANGVPGGSFGAANPVSGAASGAAFTYTEVGYFRLEPNGVYDDQFTAAVDSSPTDCTNDFSNTLVGFKYGCKFGNDTATNYFGRFVPDRFALNPDSFIDRADINIGGSEATCASSFTYMGEDFKTKFTLVAENSTPATTQNYTGGHAKFDLATWSNFVFTASSGALLQGSAAPSGAWGSTAGTYGTAAVTATHKVTRPTSPAAPYTSFSVSAQPSYTDSTATIALAASTAVHAGTSEQRFGRLRLLNAYGSELLDVGVPLRAEFYTGTGWNLNSADSCTALPTSSFFTSGALAPVIKSASPITLSGGGGTLIFNKTAATGSFDLAANLNAAGTDTSCNATHGGAGANMSWLQGFWAPAISCNTTPAWEQDPNARIKLGSPRAPYIYLRERY